MHLACRTAYGVGDRLIDIKCRFANFCEALGTNASCRGAAGSKVRILSDNGRFYPYVEIAFRQYDRYAAETLFMLKVDFSCSAETT